MYELILICEQNKNIDDKYKLILNNIKIWKIIIDEAHLFFSYDKNILNYTIKTITPYTNIELFALCENIDMIMKEYKINEIFDLNVNFGLDFEKIKKDPFINVCDICPYEADNKPISGSTFNFFVINICLIYKY